MFTERFWEGDYLKRWLVRLKFSGVIYHIVLLVFYVYINDNKVLVVIRMALSGSSVIIGMN